MSSTTASPTGTPELSVVMPVFDEEAVIGEVLRGWTRELRRLEIEFELRVYDDGSTDGTSAVVERVAGDDPAIVAIRQENRGHGPAVLRGYAEARGAWVFQTDSDDELSPKDFEDLWRRRADYDLLLAERRGREQGVGRRLISATSRTAVRLLFGAGVRDVNSPYRLFRRQALDRLLPAVPAGAFAPNVVLSGLAVRARLRIYEGTAACRGRRTGRSLPSSRLAQGAVRALGETLGAAVAARRRPP